MAPNNVVMVDLNYLNVLRVNLAYINAYAKSKALRFRLASFFLFGQFLIYQLVLTLLSLFIQITFSKKPLL